MPVKKTPFRTNKEGRSRLEIGVGATQDSVLSMLMGSLCAVYALPTVAKVQWDVQGVMSNAAVQKTFGSTISIFANPDPDGVDEVFNTPGLINGEFQTPVLACAIGVHLEVGPFMFAARGNSFPRPASPPAAKQFSPDAWTVNDQTNAWTGAIAPSNRALLVYNEPAARFFWCLVRGYNLRWTYGSQINILDEQLRETAYMPPNPQEGSASSSELDLLRVAREVNDRYASTAIGSVADFTIIDTVRTGSIGSGPNLGLFAPSNDFQTVPITYGGADLRSKIGIGQNSEFRSLTNPRILRSGVPIGMEFDERNSILGNLGRSEIDATQGYNAGVPAVFTESSDFNVTASSEFLERTVDGLNVEQEVIAGTALYKGFNMLLSNEIKGWELSEGLYNTILNAPDLAAKLCTECGILLTWGQ